LIYLFYSTQQWFFIKSYSFILPKVSFHDFTFAIFRIIKEVSVVGEASGRQVVTASSGKVEIASMGQPVESSFNKVASIFKSISWHLLVYTVKKG
jgi:hypothetical protein